MIDLSLRLITWKYIYFTYKTFYIIASRYKTNSVLSTGQHLSQRFVTPLFTFDNLEIYFLYQILSYLRQEMKIIPSPPHQPPPTTSITYLKDLIHIDNVPRQARVIDQQHVSSQSSCRAVID